LIEPNNFNLIFCILSIGNLKKKKYHHLNIFKGLRKGQRRNQKKNGKKKFPREGLIGCLERPEREPRDSIEKTEIPSIPFIFNNGKAVEKVNRKGLDFGVLYLKW
jgi:hypothetical protein